MDGRCEVRTLIAPGRSGTVRTITPRPSEGWTKTLGKQEASARARQGARAHQQGDAGPLRSAGDRRQDALLEHRGGAGRPRPPQGRARGPDPRGAAGGAREGGEGSEERSVGKECVSTGRARWSTYP